jgi:hypothetical protein
MEAFNNGVFILEIYKITTFLYSMMNNVTQTVIGHIIDMKACFLANMAKKACSGLKVQQFNGASKKCTKDDNFCQ